MEERAEEEEVSGPSADGTWWEVYKAATMHEMPHTLQLEHGACRRLTVNQPALAARAVLDEAPAIVPNGSCSFVWRRLSMRRGALPAADPSLAPMLACMDMDLGR